MKKIKFLVPLYRNWEKLLLTMKLCLLFLLISTASLMANSGYSQNTTLSIHLKNATLRDLITEVEKQSEFIFVFYDKAVDLDRKIDVQVENQTIDKVLDEVLKSSGLTYRIFDRQIGLGKRDPLTGEIVLPASSDKLVADEKIITGVIKDIKGELLPGVTVIAKGTTIGAITDTNGQFSLKLPLETKTLIFSFVGMKTQEINITENSAVNIVMEEEAIGIEEVVVVGYGTQRKVNLTGAVSSVNFDDVGMQSRSKSNVSSLLSGMTSGIRVQQINGLPSDNDKANITIRGTGSLNASSNPLILVDGQIADISTVSPNDVANVSILKDAASAAIYGSRASGGVILITTKTGKDSAGKVTFNFTTTYGKKTLGKLEDLVSNTPDFMEYNNMALANSGLPIRHNPDFIKEYRDSSEVNPIVYPNTNWMKAVTDKETPLINHHFSANGGTDKIKFYSAIDYHYDDGLVFNTSFKRINFRNNLNYQVNDWLKLGNNITVITTEQDPASISGVFEWMRASQPCVLPRHPDGRYGAGSYQTGAGGGNQPRLFADRAVGENKVNQIQGKIFAVITPVKDLSITGSYFRDVHQRKSWNGSKAIDQWNFRTNTVFIDRTTSAILSLSNNYAKNEREIIDVYADYKVSVDNHNLHALAGYNQEYFFQEDFSGSRQGLLSYDTPVLDAASGTQTSSGSASDFAMRSFFGRLSYDFNGKYLFESNLRYDGSSRFAPDERWGLFPSVSGGWIISQEDFFKPISNVINHFKIRASWGQLGNNGIGNYEWQSFYSPSNYAAANAVAPGLNYSTYGNPSITWETTNIINIGADIQLLNSLTFDVNLYNKHTNNILTNTPIPFIYGGITAPRVNSAEVLNRGIETEARYSKRFGKFSVNLSGNMAYNNNKILKYKGDLIEPRGNYSAWTEDQPIGIFYIMEIDHIVQDVSEIDAMVADGYTFFPSKPGAGDFLYKDNNGDKIINTNDRIMKGNPIPKITYGGNLALAYAGFDFSLYFDGVAKWDKYIDDAVYRYQYTEGYQVNMNYFKNHWTPENKSTTVPKIYTNNPKNHQFADWYLYKGDYMKIRSIQFGYTIPSKIASHARLNNVRAYVNLEDWFTFTKYPAMDPEQQATEGHHNTYPLTKTATIGLNISF